MKRTLAESDTSKHESDGKAQLHVQDLSVLGHDMRAHLSPIKICAEMLQSHIYGSLNGKQEQMVGTICRCADKLEDLIRDVSDAYKLESKSLVLSKTMVSVQCLMDDCAALLGRLISEKQVELKIEVGADIEILVDKNRMEQVLVNLVKNAVDYVPDDGGKISIQVTRDGQNLLFSIEDNGEGVRKEDLEKIFTKFYKGNSARQRKHGGSGLGLAICKGIVLEHGGKIWADAKHGHGAIFRFTIPI